MFKILRNFNFGFGDWKVGQLESVLNEESNEKSNEGIFQSPNWLRKKNVTFLKFEEKFGFFQVFRVFAVFSVLLHENKGFKG
jgi:hypothetical protein